MDARSLSDDLTVSGQIEAADVAKIAASGFRAIICNRPDGESADQPAFAEIAAAATAAGLDSRYQPVISGQMTPQNVTDFAALLDALPKPVFAYCRSGTRCTNLYTSSRDG